jgi:uncharacterized integral membrane protein
MLSIVISLILLGVGIYIALGNNEFVNIDLFGTPHDQPVAIVILCALGFGFVSGIFSMISAVVSKSIQVSNLKQKIREYEIAEEADKDVIYRAPGLGQDGENII